MPTLSFVRQDTDTTGTATHKTTASFTPSAGDLLIVTVQIRGQTGQPTVTDTQSLGWTLVGSGVAYNVSADRSWVFVANAAAAGSSMTIDVDEGAACTEIVLGVYKVAAATRFGASAVRAFGKKENDSGANIPSAALPQAALTTNGCLVQCGNNASGGITGPTGWTDGLVFEFQAAGSAHGSFVNSGFTGTTAPWADHIGNGTNSYDWIVEFDFSSGEVLVANPGYDAASLFQAVGQPGVGVFTGFVDPTPAPVAAGQTVAIGQAIETDVAQPFAASKTRVLGIAIETDLAQPFGRIKTRALGIASEIDLAQAFGKLKTRTLGIATEVDLAQTFGKAKTKALGVVTETDLAQALGRVKSITLGVASETDLAQAFGKAKTKTLGIATELDLAQPIAGAAAAAVRKLRMLMGFGQ